MEVETARQNRRGKTRPPAETKILEMGSEQSRGLIGVYATTGSFPSSPAVPHISGLGAKVTTKYSAYIETKIDWITSKLT